MIRFIVYKAHSMATAVSFTGGKDSMLALHLVSGYQHPLLTPFNPAQVPAVKLLITFAPTGSDFKAHPLPIIKALADKLSIQHVVCQVTAPFLDSYNQHMQQLHKSHGITHFVTGDILDVASGFMEAAVRGSNVQLLRPLWQQPRPHVLQALQDLGIRSKLSCVDLNKYQAITGPCWKLQTCPSMTEAYQASKEQVLPGLNPSTRESQQGHVQLMQQQQQGAHQALLANDRDNNEYDSKLLAPQGSAQYAVDAARELLGQELTHELVTGPLAIAEQLTGADLCGERGEYHTLVFDAPMLSAPLRLVPAEQHVVESGNYRHAYIVWQPHQPRVGCEDQLH